jgi:hypothetical protein
MKQTQLIEAPYKKAKTFPVSYSSSREGKNGSPFLNSCECSYGFNGNMRETLITPFSYDKWR